MDTTNIIQKAEAEAVADVVKALHKAEVVPLTGGDEQVLIIPKGMEARSMDRLLEPYRLHPRRKQGVAELTNINAVIQHFERFHSEESVVFVDDNPDAPEIRVVYNYTAPGDGEAGFGDYGTRYRFPLSDEWKAWTAVSGETLSQQEFAEFLETHLEDIMEGDESMETVKVWADRVKLELAGPAKLMEISKGLTVNIGRQIADHRNLQTGEAQITFAEQHSNEKGDQLRVPGAFAIRLPVFKGENPYAAPVRLRYRVHGSSIVWSMAIHKVDRIFRQAMTDAMDLVEAGTKAPTYFGTPETNP